MNQSIAAQRINEYLQRNSITKEVLSQKTGIPQNEINLMLSGQATIYADSVEKFCHALGTDPNSLLMDPEELVALEKKKAIMREIHSIMTVLPGKNLRLILWLIRKMQKNDRRQLTRRLKASSLSEGV